MVSFNILIATYNQEKLVSRLLDSILKQKEHGLHNIIIQDDCSKDSTVQVIEKYKSLYPEIIVPYYNEKNLGMYGNYDLLRKRCGNADFYLIMAGDDAINDGLFEEIQDFCKNNIVDLSQKVGIYFDFEVIKPNGEKYVFKQDLIGKGYSLYSLYIRHRIYQRGGVITKSILDEYDDVILDQGLNLAEYIFDSQAIRKVEYAYYIPIVGTIYYNGIGVSTTLPNTSYYKEDEIIKLKFFLEHYTTSISDKMWLKACIYQTKYIIKPSIWSLFMMTLYYVASMTKYQFNIKSFKVFYYPVLRRGELYGGK